ncbi:MAG TPA: hypothetical protein VFE62_23295, partial [Gemmataceae bacterium]|nr:hypothetical protein [Gemmataceae bacterium]
GKYLGRDDDPSLRLQIFEEAGNAEREIVSPARHGLTEAENLALDLMLQDERRTSEFAKVLGLETMPIREQRAQVKRLKDKLKKRLERGNHGGAS